MKKTLAGQIHLLPDRESSVMFLISLTLCENILPGLGFKTTWENNRFYIPSAVRFPRTQSSLRSCLIAEAETLRESVASVGIACTLLNTRPRRNGFANAAEQFAKHALLFSIP